MSGVVGLSEAWKRRGEYPCVGNLNIGPQVIFGACATEGEYCVGADFAWGLVLFSACERHVIPVMAFFEAEGGEGIAVQGIEAAVEAWGDEVNRWKITPPCDAV